MSSQPSGTSLTVDELEERIAAKDSWSFKECLALAAEYGVKTRMVILMVHSNGKTYIDREETPEDDLDPMDK